MTNIKLAALAMFGTTLFAGCGVSPEEGQADEGNAERTSESLKQADQAHAQYAPVAVTIDNEAAAKEIELSAGPALDGRAAASAEAARASLATAASTLGSSWYTGTVSAGGTQHWIWNNADGGTTCGYVYKVGLSPVGATTSNACRFQVTRTYDSQVYGVGRQFHFIIQNVGSIACGANVLLAWQSPANATWATGGLNPGQSQGWVWNNANPLNAAYFVNISPSGATSTNTCDMEVTRSWYAKLTSGERKFYFNDQNVGSIACSGTICLAWNTSVNSSWSTGTLAAGASASWVWNNANPLNRVYVPGVNPATPGSGTCQMELLQTTYEQIINSDGTTQRRYYVGVKNVGSVSCSGTLLLNYIDV
jgi:hypothetical protein